MMILNPMYGSKAVEDRVVAIDKFSAGNLTPQECLSVLSKYKIDTVVIERRMNRFLINMLENNRFKITFDNRRFLIFKKNEIPDTM